MKKSRYLPVGVVLQLRGDRPWFSGFVAAVEEVFGVDQTAECPLRARVVLRRVARQRHVVHGQEVLVLVLRQLLTGGAGAVIAAPSVCVGRLVQGAEARQHDVIPPADPHRFDAAFKKFSINF